jgi:hypothetical protein
MTLVERMSRTFITKTLYDMKPTNCEGPDLQTGADAGEYPSLFLYLLCGEILTSDRS